MLGALSLPKLSAPENLIPDTGTGMVASDVDAQGNDIVPAEPMGPMQDQNNLQQMKWLQTLTLI